MGFGKKRNKALIKTGRRLCLEIGSAQIKLVIRILYCRKQNSFRRSILVLSKLISRKKRMKSNTLKTMVYVSFLYVLILNVRAKGKEFLVLK